MKGSFVCDGDGKRVKSIMGPVATGVATYFVGNIYESTSGAVTKYHYAGGSRGAMRQGSNLWYLLSDHLGSTTVATDGAGSQVSELRYKPWGEVRYASGSTPTKYTFTGQFSNTSDFGLMFYNARWYDVGLGRMAQADSIVPSGVQGLDRYAYTNNSPVNFTDPSGHFVVEDDSCTQLSCSGDPDPGGVERREREEGPGHDYTVGADNVCLDLPWVDCTLDEGVDYASRFIFPGQWPGSPVVSGLNYNVWPAALWGFQNALLCWIGMCDSGAIKVNIDPNNPGVFVNRAEPPHIFYDGYVETTVYEGADGSPLVITHGEGTNDGYGAIPGPVIDEVNQVIGPITFEVLHIEMQIYSTVVETVQYVSDQ